MQTGARCAGNHKKPGSSAACVPASSPHALKFGRKNLRCPASVCKTDRQITHPHTANLPRGRDSKEAERSEGPGETGDGAATRFEPSDFAALSRSRNVAAGAKAPPAKNGADAFFPAAPSPPVCRSQYGRRKDRPFPLKLGWQARLSGRGRSGAGAAWMRRASSPPATTQGSRGRTCHAPPEPAPASTCGAAGVRSANPGHCLGHNCPTQKGARGKAQIQGFGSQGVGVGWEGGLRRSLRPLP